MTAGLVFDAVLGLLVLGIAAWTVAARQTFAAVAGFVAFGLLVAVVWVRLAAVDVALTEAAIGSGVTGAVLIAAAGRLGAGSGGRPAATGAVAAALSGAVACAVAGLVLLAPDPAPTLAPQAAAHLSVFGVGNAVTAVLLGYRSLDTLLEKIVMLLAVMGVWSLARDRSRGGRPALRTYPDGALVLLARLLPPAGIVVAVYLLWVGAEKPGGAFQGAAILAAMWLIVMLAGLLPPPQTGGRGLRLALAAGPAAFIAVGLAGFALPGGFLSYPDGFAKPVIIAVEILLMLSVAVVLGLLVLGPPAQGRR
jgi:multisubunit Na+/H+ antiporter MnhB subunit